METEKIGMREFRENLAGYLESGKPLAITRHGETLGYFIPPRNVPTKPTWWPCALPPRISMQ